MTDHPDAFLRLWGRQLYERQSEPLAWAEAVLEATGRPPTAVSAALSGRLDALADSPSGRAWLLFRTVAKLAANLRGDGRYDADVGTRIGPLALRLGELEPPLAGPLGDALGHPPDGPTSLVTVHAAELSRNRTIRLRAIDALPEWAELGHPQARAALSEVASDHRTQDVAVWTKALNRIALFGDASVEQGLLRALADTGHRGVRWSALACAELGAIRWSARAPARRSASLRNTQQGRPGARPNRRRPGTRCALAGHDETPEPEGQSSRLGDRCLRPAGGGRPDRPHHRTDPDLRALACRVLGSTADDRALSALERLAAHDLARTTLGGLVATAGQQGLRTAHRIRARTTSI
ncbi:hypothetical protein ACIRJR_36780 [Streptomyces sp. NPDC102402]|uniref:hypothetical protein n=1 Tax=Streptomyces sp. NPDC102402 TaxID=3366169 RepID=UPI00380473D2